MSEVENLRSQNDEFTALSHIYLDQFQIIKESAPYKFSILCKPYKGNQFEYQINLMFEFVKTYPQAPLKYQIEPLAGITRDSLNQIIKKIDQIIVNNKGKPLVFDIVEETRLWIHQYLVDGKSIEDEEQQYVKKEQIFERPKFAAFTPVTIENFLAWKKQFDAKHKVIKVEKKEGTEVKMSGKQWFLGKQGEIQESEDSEDEDDDDDDAEEVEIQDPVNELFNEK